MSTIIPTVLATTYSDVCSSGATRPCIFNCVNNNNLSVDYVVKFYGAIGPAVIFETLASVLGRKLGLGVPECAIVKIDPAMETVVQDEVARERLMKHSGPHFGSKEIVPRATPLNEGFLLTAGPLLEQAFDIFAFDMLIQNLDRTAFDQIGKQNILFRDTDLYPIDHEKAFSFVLLLLPDGQPWEIRDKEYATRHIFRTRLHHHVSGRGRTDWFDRFMNRLETLSITDIIDVTENLPNEWYNKRYEDKIVEHFRLVFENLDRFRDGLLEAIA